VVDFSTGFEMEQEVTRSRWLLPESSCIKSPKVYKSSSTP
jgi:hypothetical protein